MKPIRVTKQTYFELQLTIQEARELCLFMRQYKAPFPGPLVQFYSELTQAVEAHNEEVRQASRVQ